MAKREARIESCIESLVRHALGSQVADIKGIRSSTCYEQAAFEARIDPRLKGAPEQTRMPR
jgi:hypothetical protein